MRRGVHILKQKRYSKGRHTKSWIKQAKRKEQLPEPKQKCTERNIGTKLKMEQDVAC